MFEVKIVKKIKDEKNKSAKKMLHSYEKWNTILFF